MKRFSLYDFLAESNRIEGIEGVRDDLVAVAEAFLAKNTLARQDVVDFVAVAQPNAALRDRRGLNVYVGDHVPPGGGAHIVAALDNIIHAANNRLWHPYFVHIDYETLHPFTDGNGRSGRILWLWMMGGIERAPLGFLHHWYYQSLQFSRAANQNAEARP